MTTGATGQLGLALPVQGELSGTWGDTVNNGLTQYINIAIAGTLTLTNDGAVNLQNTTGDASASNITSTLTGAGTVTAQFAIVRVTGTLTTAKVVTGPSYSKTYTVVNAATGGIVTFKASGQTGVSVAVGETAFVYFNGTDYVKVVGTATAGAAGGSNTQVQFNSSGVLAGSSNMTFNGTILTAAGFSGPLNGTVGATTPTTGAFTTLSASGTNASILASGATTAARFAQFINDGSVNGLIFGTEGTTAGGILTGTTSYSGIISQTANLDLALGTNGVARLFIKGAGNVGIGTSSPTTKLEVNGNVFKIYDQSTANANLVIRNTTTGDALGFTLQQDGVNSLFYNSSNGYMAFATNATEKVRIDTSGNLLVGTSTVTAGISQRVLQVTNGTNGLLLLGSGATLSPIPRVFGGDTYDLGLAAGVTTGKMVFYTNDAERMRITDVGQVGIGTSTFATNSKFAVQTSTCKLDITSEGGSSIKLLASSGGITLSAPSGFFFDTSGTQQFEARDLQLYSNGTIKATTSISVGNATPTTSGAGITFPATQSASSDANTLDDYEEGTWTPVVAGSTTAGSIAYSYQYGYYTKIGRLVYVYFDVDVSSFSGGAGGLTITSFPFPAANLTNFFSTFQPWAVASAYAQTYTTPTGIVNPNGSLMNMYSTDDEHANFAAMNVNQTGRISGYVVMQTA